MKKLLFFFICFVTITSLYSQNTFNKHYAFDGLAAIGNGVLVTDSCYYVSGLVVDTINDPTLYDALFLAKMDFDGNIVSSYTLLDTLSSYENWATPLLFYDNAFTSIGYGYDSLMYLYWLRMDTNDSIIAFNKFRSHYAPEDYFIRPTDALYKNGKYYITTLIGKYDTDGILDENYTVLVLDDNGNSLQEQIVYGNFWRNRPTNIVLQDNNLIIGSVKANSNLTRWNRKSYSKIIGIDTLGHIEWSWQSSSSLQQGANDLLATDDGGLVVVSGRGFLKQVNPHVKYIYWDKGLVFKLDSTHHLEWEYEFTLPHFSSSSGLFHVKKAIDNSGYTAAGDIIDLAGSNGGTILGWLTKVSPNGDSLWSRKLFYYEYPDSIEYLHHIHDLQTTPDGGYLISGQTLDSKHLSFPTQQAWFIKVDAEGCLIPGCGLVDAIEPSQKEGPPLLLYPNPASDYLNVYLGNNENKNWSFVVYNSTGQEMGRYAANISHTTYMIAVDRWQAGQYFLRVVDEDKRFYKTYKWIKQ